MRRGRAATQGRASLTRQGMSSTCVQQGAQQRAALRSWESSGAAARVVQSKQAELPASRCQRLVVQQLLIAGSSCFSSSLQAARVQHAAQCRQLSASSSAAYVVRKAQEEHEADGGQGGVVVHQPARHPGQEGGRRRATLAGGGRASRLKRGWGRHAACSSAPQALGPPSPALS